MTLALPRPRYRARLCAGRGLRHDLAIRHAHAPRLGSATATALATAAQCQPVTTGDPVRSALVTFTNARSWQIGYP